MARLSVDRLSSPFFEAWAERRMSTSSVCSDVSAAGPDLPVRTLALPLPLPVALALPLTLALTLAPALGPVDNAHLLASKTDLDHVPPPLLTKLFNML